METFEELLPCKGFTIFVTITTYHCSFIFKKEKLWYFFLYPEEIENMAGEMLHIIIITNLTQQGKTNRCGVVIMIWFSSFPH
jgi:hypothetical protein